MPNDFCLLFPCLSGLFGIFSLFLSLFFLQYLRKLNRQERVVEEVKLVLKPHYNKKHISKEDYKDILRRSVPKVFYTLIKFFFCL